MHYSHEPDLKASILLVSESDNEGGRDKENQGRANRFIEKKYRNVVQGGKKELVINVRVCVCARTKTRAEALICVALCFGRFHQWLAL